MTERFPQDAILVALLRGPKKGMTVRELQEATGRAASTVRNNISVMESDRLGLTWVVKTWTKPITYTLTEKGREVARNRARRGINEH